MSFMYLHLKTEKDGNVLAEVKTEGKPPSLGSANSRPSYGPFAVFRIDEFRGLENIDLDDLLAEVRQRLTPAQALTRLAGSIPDDDLVSMIRERMSR